MGFEFFAISFSTNCVVKMNSRTKSTTNYTPTLHHVALIYITVLIQKQSKATQYSNWRHATHTTRACACLSVTVLCRLLPAHAYHAYRAQNKPNQLFQEFNVVEQEKDCSMMCYGKRTLPLSRECGRPLSQIWTNLTVILADTQSIAINARANPQAETRFMTKHHHCSYSYITMTLN